jgi:hypothetical protein
MAAIKPEEAANFWCCASFGGARTSESGVVSGHPVKCQGLQCMAWRWLHEMEDIGGVSIEVSTGRGFCGLAGEVDL